MAGKDVVLRVRFDTAQGKRDLAALFGGGLPGGVAPGGPVGPSAPSGPAGAPSPGRGGGGGPGGGGFALGPILAKLAAAVAGLSLVGSAGQVALSSGRDALREALLGGTLGGARGALASREAVASKFGLAYQLGLVGSDTLTQQFQMEQQFGAGAQAKGQARARADLADETFGSLKDDSKQLILDIVPILGELVQGIKAATQAMGG